MTIITDYLVNTSDGIKAPVSAKNPAELLRIMRCEGIQECKISVDWMGQHIFKNKPMTIAEVERWVQMREELD